MQQIVDDDQEEVLVAAHTRPASQEEPTAFAHSNDNITKLIALLHKKPSHALDGPTGNARQEECQAREEECLPMTVAEEECDGSFNPETPVPDPVVGPSSVGSHDLPEELKTKLFGESASIDRVQCALQELSTDHIELASDSQFSWDKIVHCAQNTPGSIALSVGNFRLCVASNHHDC